MDSAINIGFVILYILLVVSIIGVIVFPLIQMAGNFKAAKTALIGILGLVVLFFVAYSLSPSETGVFYQRMGVSPGLSKAIGAGLITTYITFGGAIISIVYTQFSRWFK